MLSKFIYVKDLEQGFLHMVIVRIMLELIESKIVSTPLPAGHGRWYL